MHRLSTVFEDLRYVKAYFLLRVPVGPKAILKENSFVYFSVWRAQTEFIFNLEQQLSID